MTRYTPTSVLLSSWCPDGINGGGGVRVEKSACKPSGLTIVAKIKMTPLREAAKGQECQIQLHPYCNGDPQRTMLCHAPCEDKGMGIKGPDYWGALGCSDCHAIIDGGWVKTGLTWAEVYEAFMRGVYRTQRLL